MANKIVSLLLQVKNAISPGVNEASKDLDSLRKRTTELEKELSKVDSANAAIKSLDDVKQAAKDAEQAFDDAQLNVIKLKEELKTTKTPELAIALEKAKIEAREAKKEFIANGKALSNLESTITRAGGDLDDLAGSEKKFTAAIDNTNGKLIAHNEKLNKAEKNFKDTGTAAETSGNSIKGFAAKLVGLVAGVAIISKIKDGFVSLAKSVFETGSEFELLGKRLSADELGYITEFARDTPLQLDGVAQAFAKLRAFGVDPMNGSLRALVDQNAALGGSQETLEGIITAVGQAWGKQKLQQEEVLQLIERGVPAWDLLAKATGRTVPELQKMATAGELGRKEIGLLLNEIAKANEGQAADAMSSLSGLVSNLKDRFTQFYLLIANSGALDYLKAQIQAVSQLFDELAASGKLEELAKKISDGFISMAETAKSLAVSVYELSGTFAALGQAWIGLKIVGWYSDLKRVSSGFVEAGRSASVAGASVKAFGLAARAAVGAVIIQGVYSIITAYQELKVAVAELDKVERERANQQNDLAAKYKMISDSTGILVTSMKELEDQIAAGNIVIDKQANKYLSAAQAAEQFNQSQIDLAAAQERAAINAGLLSEAFNDSNTALKTAIEDNSKLAGVMQSELLGALNSGVEGLGGLAIALRGVEQQGSLTSDQIQESLVVALGKLSEPEQARFGDLITEAMASIESGTDSAGLSISNLILFIKALEGSKLDATLSGFGTSQEVLTNKITKGFKASLDSLSVLKEYLLSTGIDANTAGDEIYNSLTTAFKSVQTEADKAEFTKSIDDFRSAGLLTYEQYDQLKNIINDVGIATDEMASKGESGARRIGQALADVSDSASAASNDVRGLAEGLSGFFTGIRNEVSALSEQARQAFDNRLGISSAGAVTEIEALEQAIVSAREELGKIAIDNLQVFDPTGINRWKNSVLQARDETVIAYNEQKLKALEYIDALQSGEGVNASFIRSAETSIGNMKLLGSQDLAQLRSALDSANQKLLQMKNNAASALGNLQNELDQLQGNTAAIAQREYEQKKADLEAKLKEARLYGQNEAIATYEQALKVLEQVRNEQRKQSNSAAAASNNNASPAGANYGPAPGSVTTIKLQSPSGTSEVALNGDRDAVNKLLDVLGDAGLRSAN